MLSAAGVTADGDHPAMGIDLAILPDEPQPHALTIHQTTQLADIHTWVNVSAVAFGGTETSDHGPARIFADALRQHENVCMYLGSWDGQPVATAALVCAAGVAGLYSISTLSDARGRGIGRAITLAALREARALGYRVAVLEASELGEPVYARIGFREVGRLPGYIWSPPEE